LITQGNKTVIQASNRNTRWSLRLAVQISIMLSAIVASVLWIQTNNLNNSVRELAQLQSSSQFRIMRPLLSDALYFNDAETIRKYVDIFVTQNEISQFSIFTDDGTLIFDLAQEKVPVGEIDTNLFDLVTKNIGTSTHWQGQQLAIVGAIEFDNNIIGGIYFEIDYSDQFDQIDSRLFKQYILGIISVLLGASLLFALAVVKGTTRSLKTIESNFRELINQSPVPNAIFQNDGLLVYANAAFILIMSQNDSTKSTLESGYNIFKDTLIPDSAVMSLITQGFTEATHISRFKYGHSETPTNNLWLEAVVFPLRNDNDEIQEVVLVLQNVTETKNVEDEKEILNKQILQSQKLESLGIMAGGIAHDFNNLLMPIHGNAELLALELPNDSPHQEYVAGIMSASTRAAELCNQMLTYTGEGSSEKISIDLNEEISELNKLLRSTLDKKTILKQSLSMNLPTIMANKAQSIQVIMNLLFNASEALEGREGEVTIETGTKTLTESDIQRFVHHEKLVPGEYVFLSVSDTGCGMTESTRLNLFNPFYTTKFTGRGLGLSAVLGIVTDHEGGVEVESVMDKGSTFTIYFPTSMELPLVRDDVLDIREHNFSGHILLVDDELLVREISDKMLQTLGFKVSKAENGLVALGMFKADSSVTCVLLDILMPELDGEETLREIRKIDPEMPVVMMSGFSSGDRIKRLADHTKLQILRKPFDRDDLAKAMATVNP